LKTFGESLKERRKSKDISQLDLAKKVGVDISYISKIENGKLPPPAAETILKISKVLNLPAEELLSFSGKVTDEMKDVISSSASAIKFIIKAKEMDLTDAEWDKLSSKLKSLR
jgi:HTH-type transcriptional regulator, competence development regulator